MSDLLQHIVALTGSVSDASERDRRAVDDWVRYGSFTSITDSQAQVLQIDCAGYVILDKHGGYSLKMRIKMALRKIYYRMHPTNVGSPS
jgi:hypothetical protein